MTISHGSPFWQVVLIAAALVFLLWEVWRGWRAGIVRSGVSLAAMVLSGLVGYAAAHIAAIPFGGFEGFSGAMVGLFVGGGVGLAVFIFIWVLGALLFKRTEHQPGSLVRLLWGGGGALLGLLTGLIVVWSCISVVRSLGVLAEAQVETREAASQAPSALANGLVTLRDSLEMGPAGRVVQAVDPVEPEVYSLLLQLGKLSGDQATMMRFIQYPGIQSVMESPRMVELVNNPDIIRAAEDRNIFAIMSHPALRAALEDPAFMGEIKKIDLAAALKYATTPKPSPGSSKSVAVPPAGTPAK